MSPSGTRQRPDENRRQCVTTRSGNVEASAVTSGRIFFPFITFPFIAQRKDVAREILRAGPMAKAESSRRNGSASSVVERPVESLNFPTSPYNRLPFQIGRAHV